MALNINEKILSVMGMHVKVLELESAIEDQNGRKLYEILVRGDEYDRIRAYNIDLAVADAIKAIEKNFK